MPPEHSSAPSFRKLRLFAVAAAQLLVMIVAFGGGGGVDAQAGMSLLCHVRVSCG